MNANGLISFVSSCILAALAQTAFAGSIADLNAKGCASQKETLK